MICPVCKQHTNPDRPVFHIIYPTFLGKAPEKPASKAVAGCNCPKVFKDCIYLGKETGERIECPTCSGKVQVKVMACDQPAIKECTSKRVVARPGEEPLACCHLCRLYVPKVEE